MVKDKPSRETQAQKDERLREQFKEIVAVLKSLEKDIIAGDRISQHELQLIVTTHKFSKTGVDVFTALIKQSDVISLVEDAGVTYLVKNPEFLVEEEVSVSRTWTDKLETKK